MSRVVGAVWHRHRASLPIASVHHLAEEHVAIDAPRVLENLGPFLRWIDRNGDAAKVEDFTIIGMAVGTGSRSYPLSTIPAKRNSLTIRRKAEII